MLRTLYISFLISLISLILVFSFPIKVTTQGDSFGPSPYFKDILKLQEKTTAGLHPSAPEWSQLEILRHKNNIWFENQGESNKMNSAYIFDYIKVKSSNLSLMLFIIWLVSFYYFFREKVDVKNLLVLVFPVIFLLLEVIMLIPFVFIVAAVISVFALMKWKTRTTKKLTSKKIL